SRPLPIERQPAATTSPAMASATTPTTPGERSQTMEKRSAPLSTSPEPADQLPEWPEHQFARQSASSGHALPTGMDGLPETNEPGCEPVRLVDPPVLRAPPADGAYDARPVSDRGLTIPRIQICRQVRGFEDVLPLDAQRLRSGQPVLIYATLE